MKKLFFAWLIGMVCVAGAAESPFKKGTTYLNIHFRINGNPYDKVAHPSSFGIYASGDSLGDAKLYVDTHQRFGNMAKGINLEVGLTDYLGLEFQYYKRSNGNIGLFIEGKIPEGAGDPTLPLGDTISIPLDWAYAPGTYSERVLSLGCNYHMNFIRISRLDVYTGFQLGIEEKNYTIYSRLEEKTTFKIPYLEKEFEIYPGGSGQNNFLIIYSHIGAGLNYFLNDKIAINLRSGIKIGIGGHDSKFFYGAGLTLKL